MLQKKPDRDRPGFFFCLEEALSWKTQIALIHFSPGGVVMPTRRFSRRTAMKMVAAAPLGSMVAPSKTSAEGEKGKATRANVLIVHSHDLGQYLHCYGVPTVRTPSLDGLAAEGVRFERSFCTAPQCSPSRSSIFTGRYPHSNGVMGLTHADFAWDLHPDEQHLGQILRDAGYRTAGVGVIHETRSGPKRCGLDRYAGKARATEAVDEAIGILSEFSADPSQPFYMTVGTFEPHRTHSSDPNADLGFVGEELEPDASLGVWVPDYLRETEGTRTEIAELQGAIHHLDAQVGRLLHSVDELGLRENTLVLFTADHGVALPRAKCSVYDPGLQVPLILRLPSRPGWQGGITHSPMISNVDYLPTILDLLGLPVPEKVQGKSFAPLLDGEEYVPRDAVYGEITYHDYYDPRRCIRTEHHKLILNFTTAPFFMDPSQSRRPRSDTVVPANNALAYHKHVELYDLDKDPWELANVAEDSDYEAVRKELLSRLNRHLTETGDPILEGAVTSPMHRKALSILSGSPLEE